MARFLPLAIVAFHLLVCLQTLCDQQQATSAGLVPPRVVTIVCAVPNAQLLRIHCLSKENDLGEHALVYGQEYYWEVTVPSNSTDYPRYFCGFTSGSKKQFLVVYDAKVDPSCKNNDKHECYWFVSEQGFFFSNVGKDYRKIAGWA
ncbi:S-protein homolog 24-like [Rhododendron vialii]|uniref:S-protein homolog 24-like n=1 Tax=Rhododendron vialii TaxID=182163 RepID=UPI00265F55FB|nr:S-protein homolog 24-like [Rhododendron vialii]